MDYDDYWIKHDGEDDTVIHQGRIGVGGYAEVHKVMNDRYSHQLI